MCRQNGPKWIETTGKRVGTRRNGLKRGEMVRLPFILRISVYGYYHYCVNV